MTDKQKVTLARMKKTRKADYIFLREIINDKLKWIKEEKLKGQKVIETYNEKVRETEDQVKMLDGAIIALEDVLHTKKEAEKSIESVETPEKKDK